MSREQTALPTIAIDPSSPSTIESSNGLAWTRGRGAARSTIQRRRRVARRHRSEQYRTASQQRAHFLRQANGREQCAQSLVGRSPLLRGRCRSLIDDCHHARIPHWIEIPPLKRNPRTVSHAQTSPRVRVGMHSESVRTNDAGRRKWWHLPSHSSRNQRIGRWRLRGAHESRRRECRGSGVSLIAQDGSTAIWAISKHARYTT